MKNATKFTFDTVFGTSRGSAPARERKVFTETEVEALCAEARADGMRAGEVRALEAIAAGAQQTALAVRQALEGASAQIEAVRAEAATIAFALARKVASAAVAEFPAHEVVAALRQAMHQAIGEPRIVLHATPEVIEALSERITEIAQDEGYDGRVQISADATLKGADCRIEWRGGGAERSDAAIESALNELMARRFAFSGAAKDRE